LTTAAASDYFFGEDLRPQPNSPVSHTESELQHYEERVILREIRFPTDRAPPFDPQKGLRPPRIRQTRTRARAIIAETQHNPVATMGEKRTFLPYSRGIDPNRLRIGSLAIDVYNPAQGLETERFKFGRDISQEVYEATIAQYTGEPQIDDECDLRFAATREWSARLAVPGLANLHVEPSGNVSARISGRRGRRFEVENPIAFLTKVVLRQDGVQDWIRDPLSAQSKGKLQKGKSVSYLPKIWLCTGVQLISGGRVHYHSGDATSVGGGLEVDPGLVTTGVPTGQSVAELQGHVSRQHHSENHYRHRDERVWAAQWFQLDVKFRPRRSEDEEKDMIFKLKPVEDLKHGVRKFDSPGPDGTREYAEGDAPPDIAEIVGLVMPGGDASRDGEAPQIDERPYADATRGIDWELYREYEKYLESLED